MGSMAAHTQYQIESVTKMQQFIGIWQMLSGVACGIIATVMIIHNVNGDIVYHMLAAWLTISGIALSCVGLYLVSK